MKREIKFRAWNGKEMWYNIKIMSLDGFMGLNQEIIAMQQNYELMQYTGLKDSKETEIYEGDIVEVENEEYPVITKCIWDTGQFILKDSVDGQWTRQLFHQPERLTIIGNIYENSILLTNQLNKP